MSKEQFAVRSGLKAGASSRCSLMQTDLSVTEDKIGVITADQQTYISKFGKAKTEMTLHRLQVNKSRLEEFLAKEC